MSGIPQKGGGLHDTPPTFWKKNRVKGGGMGWGGALKKIGGGGGGYAMAGGEVATPHGIGGVGIPPPPPYQ